MKTVIALCIAVVVVAALVDNAEGRRRRGRRPRCDPECEGDQLCFRGTCEDFPPTCTEECAEGEICVFGDRCVESPCAAEGCDDGQICTPRGCRRDPRVTDDGEE